MIRQQCGLCGAFLPKPAPGKPYICGKCGTEFENTMPVEATHNLSTTNAVTNEGE